MSKGFNIFGETSEQVIRRLQAEKTELLAALKALIAKIDPAILVEHDLENSDMADEYRAAEAAIAKAERRKP